MSLVKILTHACTGCGICVESCPLDVLRMAGNKAVVAYPEDCQACMLCVFDCPRRAVEVRGADYERLTLTLTPAQVAQVWSGEKPVLVLNDQQVRDLLPMDEAIAAMEDSYREVAEGVGKNLPRARLRTAAEEGTGWNFMFNCIPGMLPRRGVMAVRLDAAVREFNPERAHVRYYDDRYTGWVVLFSTRTGEPLAIMDDFSLSGIRVGASVGVAAKYLARSGASRVALYGSGKQARTNLEAVSKVRSLEEVRVYSPNPDHRVLFAQEMTDVIGAEIVPVSSPREAMQDADIVLCTANAMEPIFDGAWLKPSMFVSSISVGQDKTHTEITGRPRREVDDVTLDRADVIIINSRQQAIWDDQKHLLRLAEKHGFGPDRALPELGDLLVGRVPGRQSDEEVVLFANNTGIGNQFSAAGAVVYENARRRGEGRNLPNEWFMSDVSTWAERGFFPSP